jgi:hypothetical protein
MFYFGMSTRARPDAVLALAVALAIVVCATLLVGTVAYWTYGAWLGAFQVPVIEALQVHAFGAGIAGAVQLAGAIARGLVTRSHIFACLVGVALAFVASFTWFVSPMHDIGLLFGSHGRWGCTLLDDGGRPFYWLRTDMAPFAAFAPSALLLLWRGSWCCRR